MAQAISFNLNGRPVTVQIDDPKMPLLYALRDDLGLHGPRFGCGLSQCGACTVHLEGKAVRSCVTPISTVAHRRVVTLEGLGTQQKLHPLQQAFIDEQAMQCGYCMNGMIMQAAALLQENKHPNDDAINRPSRATSVVAEATCALSARSDVLPARCRRETEPC
jgi:nicotinate dehydrogenase subunit A